MPIAFLAPFSRPEMPSAASGGGEDQDYLGPSQDPATIRPESGPPPPPPAAATNANESRTRKGNSANARGKGDGCEGRAARVKGAMCVGKAVHERRVAGVDSRMRRSLLRGTLAGKDHGDGAQRPACGVRKLQGVDHISDTSLKSPLESAAPDAAPFSFLCKRFSTKGRGMTRSVCAHLETAAHLAHFEGCKR